MYSITEVNCWLLHVSSYNFIVLQYDGDDDDDDDDDCCSYCGELSRLTSRFILWSRGIWLRTALLLQFYE